MERKTKHRILAALVIVGLIIILLPYFQAQQISDETSLVAPPAFPEETPINTEAATPVEPAVEPLPNLNPENKSPEPATGPANVTSVNDKGDADRTPFVPEKIAIDGKESKPAAGGETQKTETPVTKPATTTTPATKPMINDSSTRASITSDKTLLAEANAKIDDPSTPEDTVSTQEKSVTVVTEPKIDAHPDKVISKKSATTSKNVSKKAVKKSYTPSTSENKKVSSVSKLKSKVWAVQIGSFSQKDNALHLINQLRAKGYHAFIQEKPGKLTRVYVGPGNQKQAMKSLADKINQDFHLSGLVVPYNPLAI